MACSETSRLSTQRPLSTNRPRLVVTAHLLRSERCNILGSMALLNVIIAVATAAVAWLTWELLKLLQTGRQLAPIPSPPIQPGLFNRVLGHLSYLTQTNQYHRVTLKWSQDHGTVCKLRFLNNYVSQHCKNRTMLAVSAIYHDNLFKMHAT